MNRVAGYVLRQNMLSIKYIPISNNIALHYKPLRLKFDSLDNGKRFINYNSQLKSEKKNKQLLLPTVQDQLLSLKPITPNDAYVSCTVFNKKGDITAVSQKFAKWSFIKEHNLYPRDLRKIDTSSVDIIPTILVKNNCIVLNMLYIKALICKDTVYVFDTANPESAMKLGVLMYDLELKLSEANKNNNIITSNPTGSLILSKQCYEHKALESMLINVMSSLEEEFKLHSSVCGHILSALENEVNRDSLRDLLIKSKYLSLFYQKSLLIREVLDELLENDEDMAKMYLSLPKTENDDFAELEMLLETYYTQCDEYVQQAESLLQDIRTTEEIVNIILDANRNALMLLELKVTIYTLGITVATLLPAFYGMNLKNFIEESAYGFGGVVFFSVISALIVTRSNFRQLRSVTKLTMLNNHSGSLSPKHKKLAKAYTDQQVPTFFGKFKMWILCTWKGKNSINQNTLMRKKREMVWKWLIEDKKM